MKVYFKHIQNNQRTAPAQAMMVHAKVNVSCVTWKGSQHTVENCQSRPKSVTQHHTWFIVTNYMCSYYYINVHGVVSSFISWTSISRRGHQAQLFSGYLLPGSGLLFFFQLKWHTATCRYTTRGAFVMDPCICSTSSHSHLCIACWCYPGFCVSPSCYQFQIPHFSISTSVKRAADNHCGWVRVHQFLNFQAKQFWMKVNDNICR